MCNQSQASHCRAGHRTSLGSAAGRRGKQEQLRDPHGQPRAPLTGPSVSCADTLISWQKKMYKLNYWPSSENTWVPTCASLCERVVAILGLSLAILQRMIIRPIHFLIAALLLTLGCVEDSQEENTGYSQAPLSISDDIDTQTVHRRASLLITNADALRGLEFGNRLGFGQLLASLGRSAMQEYPSHSLWGNDATPQYNNVDDWVESVFRRAAVDFEENRDSPSNGRIRIGVIHTADNPWQRVLELWPELYDQDTDDVGRGPFRLLAVVNRMDLAGDTDPRGNGPAMLPRPFGEGRLIFGLIDPIAEAAGKPYPLTFILEYKLPALDSDLDVDLDYDYSCHGDNAASCFRSDWETVLTRWSQVWRELSAIRDSETTGYDTNSFRTQLRQIARAFASPDNFAALRANVQLTNANNSVEHELRSWYLFQPQWNLIPRRLRNEPYRCASTGTELASIVESFWDSETQDLIMEPFRFVDDGRAYEIPRRVIDFPYPSLGLETSTPIAGCETTEYDIYTPVGDSWANLARVARVQEEDVWTPSGLDTPESEAKRHAFAIRTCSGCHSAESGAFGFHVSPRLEGKGSRVSRFLKGGATFSRNGATYEYDELGNRKRFLLRAAKAKIEPTDYEGLLRHDLVE